jgi:hypothetical protein
MPVFVFDMHCRRFEMQAYQGSGAIEFAVVELRRRDVLRIGV